MKFFPVKVTGVALCFGMSMLIPVKSLAFESNAQLLQKQWHVGDANTSDYLQPLPQQVEQIFADIESQTQFKLSEIMWLLSDGKMSTITKPFN